MINIITLKYSILRDIGTLARSIGAINDIKYAEFALHRNQYIFLTRICENEGISFRDLTIMLKIDKATTTTAVQKLIKNSYVTKEQDKNDGRIFRLYPTDKSKEIYKYIIEEENRVLDICFDGFSKKEKDSIHKLINKMNLNIEQDWHNVKKYKGGTNDK